MTFSGHFLEYEMIQFMNPWGTNSFHNHTTTIFQRSSKAHVMLKNEEFIIWQFKKENLLYSQEAIISKTRWKDNTYNKSWRPEMIMLKNEGKGRKRENIIV